MTTKSKKGNYKLPSWGAGRENMNDPFTQKHFNTSITSCEKNDVNLGSFFNTFIVPTLDQIISESPNMPITDLIQEKGVTGVLNKINIDYGKPPFKTRKGFINPCYQAPGISGAQLEICASGIYGLTDTFKVIGMQNFTNTYSPDCSSLTISTDIAAAINGLTIPTMWALPSIIGSGWCTMNAILKGSLNVTIKNIKVTLTCCGNNWQITNATCDGIIAEIPFFTMDSSDSNCKCNWGSSSCNGTDTDTHCSIFLPVPNSCTALQLAAMLTPALMDDIIDWFGSIINPLLQKGLLKAIQKGLKNITGLVLPISCDDKLNPGCSLYDNLNDCESNLSEYNSPIGCSWNDDTSSCQNINCKVTPSNFSLCHCVDKKNNKGTAAALTAAERALAIATAEAAASPFSAAAAAAVAAAAAKYAAAAAAAANKGNKCSLYEDCPTDSFCQQDNSENRPGCLFEDGKTGWGAPCNKVIVPVSKTNPCPSILWKGILPALKFAWNISLRNMKLETSQLDPNKQSTLDKLYFNPATTPITGIVRLQNSSFAVQYCFAPETLFGVGSLTFADKFAYDCQSSGKGTTWLRQIRLVADAKRYSTDPIKCVLNMGFDSSPDVDSLKPKFDNKCASCKYTATKPNQPLLTTAPICSNCTGNGCDCFRCSPFPAETNWKCPSGYSKQGSESCCFTCPDKPKYCAYGGLTCTTDIPNTTITGSSCCNVNTVMDSIEIQVKEDIDVSCDLKIEFNCVNNNINLLNISVCNIHINTLNIDLTCTELQKQEKNFCNLVNSMLPVIKSSLTGSFNNNLYSIIQPLINKALLHALSPSGINTTIPCFGD